MDIPDNLFADLLAYQETDEFKRAATEQRESERKHARIWLNAYLHDHPNKRRAYARHNRQTPNGKLRNRLHAHRRRIRVHCASHVTPQEIHQQRVVQKGCCYYCRRLLQHDWQVDHVMPLSRGGTDTADNVVLACPTCNSRKRDKMPHEWAEGGRLL